MARGIRTTRGVARLDSVVLPNGITIATVDSAPTDGTNGTGAGKYNTGSLVIALDTGIPYSNAGTMASPAWIKMASGSFHSASASKSPSASSSRSASPSSSASKSPSASVSPSSSTSPSKSPSASASPS